MKRVVTFPDQARIMEEAAVWIAKLDNGSVDAVALKAMRVWAEQSDLHREALERSAEAWDDLDVLTACKGLIEAPVAPKRSRWLPSAVAAGLAVLAVSTWFLAGSQVPGSAALEQTAYRTKIGEQKTVPLPDGSQIQLNTDSRVEVAYSNEQRNVRLQEGEAFFEVAKSQDKPFVVTTEHGSVTAIGTAFSVRLAADSMEVVVSEGEVRVGMQPLRQLTGRQDDPGAEFAILGAGQSTTVGDEDEERVKTLEPTEVERVLAWRGGMLVFAGEPLGQVIEEVSRYTKVKIIISSPQLRDLHIGGYFKAGETQALLATLESGFGVTVDYVKDDLIYLRIDES